MDQDPSTASETSIYFDATTRSIQAKMKVCLTKSFGRYAAFSQVNARQSWPRIALSGSWQNQLEPAPSLVLSAARGGRRLPGPEQCLGAAKRPDRRPRRGFLRETGFFHKRACYRPLAGPVLRAVERSFVCQPCSGRGHDGHLHPRSHGSCGIACFGELMRLAIPTAVGCGSYRGHE